MAGIEGAATKVGYVNSLSASVYGTALDMTSYTNAKICCSISENFSASEEIDDGIGCGSNTGFIQDVKLGQKEYRVGLNGTLGFQSGFDRILAQFFGAESTPAEETADEDDWLHTFKFAALSNQRFGTLTYETGSASVIELPSTYATRIQISMEKVQGYVKWSADLVSNTAVYTGKGTPVNTNSDLAGLSILNDERVFAECVHTFRMKEMLDDGTDTALDSGDQFNITTFDLELETPLEVIPEMTGGACNNPSQSDRKNGSLTIGLKEHVDNVNSYVAWENGTSFMAEIEWKGSQINDGEYHSFKVRIPKMRLINSPGYSISNAGKNGLDLVFTLLESSTTLTGFTSKGVEVDIINKQEALYLAASV